jgi:23S rRNA G2445 N2-methylase RlmL
MNTRLFYTMTMPGLETLAFSEIHACVPDAELEKFARGITLFRTATHPTELLALRTVEDVFFALVHVHGLGHGRDALGVLHSATLHADVKCALTMWQRARTSTHARTWRVVSQMSGKHDFRRIEAGQSVSAALQRALPRSLQAVDDDADLEFWLWINGSEVLLGLRLSDATMRHRHYKQEHMSASLRPTIAAAMAWLARPTNDDIVLDPLCGVGTVIIERALLTSYDRLIGGDIQDEALAMARRNARFAEVTASWRVWDARSLPLDAASVTRIITNLPFGKQIGTHETNEKLYTALAHEFRRVLVPDGVLVTLTSEDQLWDSLLRDCGWRVVKKLVLVVLGQPASIFVAEQA